MDCCEAVSLFTNPRHSIRIWNGSIVIGVWEKCVLARIGVSKVVYDVFFPLALFGSRSGGVVSFSWAHKHSACGVHRAQGNMRGILLRTERPCIAPEEAGNEQDGATSFGAKRYSWRLRKQGLTIMLLVRCVTKMTLRWL